MAAGSSDCPRLAPLSLAPLCLLRLPLHLQGRAERAGPGWPPILVCAARCGADSGRRSYLPIDQAGLKSGEPCAPGAACRSWALPGHGGVGAHLVPAAARTGLRRNESALARVLQEVPSLRRPIMKPRKIVVKVALRASLRDQPFGPLDHESCRGFIGAYRRDGRVRGLHFDVSTGTCHERFRASFAILSLQVLSIVLMIFA